MPVTVSSFVAAQGVVLLCCCCSTLVDRPCSHNLGDRFVGLVVKVSASRAEDSAFESRLRRDFSRVNRVIQVT